MNTPQQTLVLTDLPHEEALEFNFEEFIETLREFISSVPNDAPFSIRVSGGWGTGKTTLLSRLETALQEESAQGDSSVKYISAWFDPWKLSSEVEVRNALARCVLKVIESDGGFATNVKMSIQRKNVIRMLSDRLLSVDADEVDTFYRMDAKVRDTFVEVEELFKKVAEVYLNDPSQHRRLVIFVDDLDRCQPSRVREVLEAVKLFFDLPGLIFVFALDSAQLERAVSSDYKINEDEAREYLEKMFQLTITLPRKKSDDLHQYLAGNLAKIGVKLENKGLYSAIVDRYGRNLRNLKLFINWFSFQRQLVGQVGGVDEETLFRWLYLESTMSSTTSKTASKPANVALALEFLAYGGFLHDKDIQLRYLAELDAGEINYVALIVYSIVMKKDEDLAGVGFNESQRSWVEALQKDGEVIPTLKVLRESRHRFIDTDMTQVIYLTRNTRDTLEDARSASGSIEAQKQTGGALSAGNPLSPSEWNRLGDKMITAGNTAEAYLCYLMAALMEPERGMYICDLSRPYRLAGQDAVRELQYLAYQLDPTSVYILVEIATFHDVTVKDEVLGSLLYRKILAEGTPTSIVPYYLAMNLEKEGNYRDAYLACLDAAIREPEDTAKRERLAHIGRRAGLPDQPIDRAVEDMKEELGAAVAAGEYPKQLTPDEEQFLEARLNERPDPAAAAEQLSRPPFY
ncbi:MAG TPA: P-loop NTPase fold protein [Solirubrobacterales bacterium]|nr:P-loop NTPase fold protein [Solirubrobacterales bacterium]